MKTIKILSLFIILVVSVQQLCAQGKVTREEYIEKYKHIAIEHQEIYGIPASIKMAQALLESDNGNSRLAILGNNHFGIKCKSDWKGESMTHDDDAKGECFRKYATAEDSFKDHSEFLDNSARYNSLFDLDPKDYQGWAQGLKSAGYATNPQYAQMLIKIIEDNKLYLLDSGVELPVPVEEVDPVIVLNKPAVEQLGELIDVDNYMVTVSNVADYAVYVNNGSEFIVAKEGDTYESVSPNFLISAKKLRKFNDVENFIQPKKGEMIYIKHKAKRSNNGKTVHVAKDGETLHALSQMYGIQLKRLIKINMRTPDTPLGEGQQIRLM